MPPVRLSTFAMAVGITLQINCFCLEPQKASLILTFVKLTAFAYSVFAACSCASAGRPDSNSSCCAESCLSVRAPSDSVSFLSGTETSGSCALEPWLSFVVLLLFSAALLPFSVLLPSSVSSCAVPLWPGASGLPFLPASFWPGAVISSGSSSDSGAARLSPWAKFGLSWAVFSLCWPGISWLAKAGMLGLAAAMPETDKLRDRIKLHHFFVLRAISTSFF